MGDSNQSRRVVKGSSATDPKEVRRLIKEADPTFPLTPHASGRFYKKVRAKHYYFGRWAERDAGGLKPVPGYGVDEARKEWQAFVANGYEHPDPNRPAVVTVGKICNMFRARKKQQSISGELTERMYSEYSNSCDLLVSRLGARTDANSLGPAHFSRLNDTFVERWGPVRRSNEIQKVRTIFRWAAEQELIEKIPNYGSDFVKPTKSVLRRHRAKRKRERGTKMLTAKEILAVLDVADVFHKPMILLAINCGLGVRDLIELPLSAIDLDAAMLDFDRPKSGIERRSALWEETVTALKEWLKVRPEPTSDRSQRLVFLSAKGTSPSPNALSQQIRKVFTTAGVHRAEVGLSWCRPTFRTVADSVGDNPACRLAMGHSDSSIDDTYRQEVCDDRLRRIARAVHEWLFGESLPPR